MAARAVALRPQLLARARELTGGRDADAEDLVAVAYLAMVERPPRPSSPAQLKHWLRTVIRNQHARSYRDVDGAETVSYEAIQEPWSRRS
jgi:DNA-directed RNA polymerase specialized sigma24 family protein